MSLVAMASRQRENLTKRRPGPVGSWAWLEETGGNLTGRERVHLLPALAATFGRFSVDRLRLVLRARSRHALSAEDLWPQAPDSRLSREAAEEGRALQSTPTLHHGYRTWVFGSALARIDGANLDPELFHAGALVHDLGLEHIEPQRCFTYRSALAARAAAERAEVAEDRILSLMDGIGMHVTPGLRTEDSALGFYLQAGAMADLAGLRVWELPSELWDRANRTYARERIHQVLSTCWHAEAKAVPGGRARFADTWGGFSRIIRWLPVRR
jgi:hypothetical protein